MPVHDIAYQATDLARNHREVIDAARNGGAFIRDKDGLALIMAPAEQVERADTIARMAMDLVRAERAIGLDAAFRDPSAYGGIAWLSVLPDGAQRRFLDEMGEALVVAFSGASLRPVMQLIGDWQATADAWADVDTRERLMADEDVPLHNVEL